jgi:small nuclear ribonucleoprotein (snRNP)-like protein
MIDLLADLQNLKSYLNRKTLLATAMEYYNMLIDKGASVGEVVTLKLTSGEELIGKLVEETDAHYKLSRPMVIAMGAQGPGLMPYLFTVSPEKDIKLSKSTVTVVAVTDKMFADQFIQSTTGIKLV